MSTNFKNAVCRGSLALGSGCGRCERCENERIKQRVAERSDTHTLPDQSAPSTVDGHVKGLPVAGYAKQVDQWKVDVVNGNKKIEEQVLRLVDQHADLAKDGKADGASVQLARRHVEDAFYRLNRAIMQPQRIQGDL